AVNQIRARRQPANGQGARPRHPADTTRPRRPGDRMKRREFITLIGGAVAAWPHAVRAQQGERMRRIGVLAGGALASDADTRERNVAFAQGLQQLGWIEGRNVQIDYRYGLGKADKVREYAAELVRLQPDVLVVSGASALAPLLHETRTLPIVFVSVA